MYIELCLFRFSLWWYERIDQALSGVCTRKILFSGNETWQRYRPLRNIIFKNMHAVDIAMPITLYGTESNQVELTMENIFIHMREGSVAEELIRACHYSRISIDHMQIDGFKGGCLIKSRCGKDIELHNVVCALPEKLYVVKTTEDFVIKII
ncbi:MAG: hypothetical protein IJX80_01315 [Clostridia bacterium]|nr:hypothetical protein [Clostridia bacterium]